MSQVTRGNNMFTTQNFPPLTGCKRPRIQSPTHSITEDYDRFFKISLTDGSFKAMSPFLINKCLHAHFGTLKDIRKLADGSLLIETANEKQSSLANTFTKLSTYEVSTVPHPSLNIVKGIITCFDLANCDDQEILENLADQAVTAVYRIPSKKGSIRPSATFILSFKLHQLPKTIKAGFYSLRVRQYFPNPIRCYNCQRFGHTSSKCANQSICPSCGQSKHPETECTSEPFCINCTEKHSPAYRGCRVYKHEFEIQKIKTLENIPYHEAKRKLKETIPPLNQPFNVVTAKKPKMISQSIQCDLSPSPRAGEIVPTITQDILTSSPLHPPPIPSTSKTHSTKSSKNRPSQPPTSNPPDNTPLEKSKGYNFTKHQSNSPTINLTRLSPKSNKNTQSNITKSLDRKTPRTKDPPKNPRSNKSTPKTTPNSSRESILELTSPDSMDLEPSQ